MTHSMSLEEIVRKLRDDLFMATAYRRPHERQWETEDDELRRETQNHHAKRRWDDETERMIREATD